MSLADRAPRNQPNRTRCTVCVLVETLPPDDAAVLKRWLADPECQSNAISRELKAEYGDNVPTGTTIGRHRRGECRGTR